MNNWVLNEMKFLLQAFFRDHYSCRELESRRLRVINNLHLIRSLRFCRLCRLCKIACISPDAPVCRSGQKVLFGVATREPVQVPCEVDANPAQVSFYWNLNNSLEILPIKNFITSKMKSVAIYSPRTKFGYGQLLCWASNSIGMQREPCVFTVIAAGPPDPVTNCIVGNVSLDSLIVKCHSGDDGGLEQTFFMEVYHSGRGVLQANLSSLTPVFEIHALPMSTSFVLVLFSANAKGRSNSVALTASTLPLLNKGKEC